jgi:hypothetical protein
MTLYLRFSRIYYEKIHRQKKLYREKNSHIKALTQSFTTKTPVMHINKQQFPQKNASEKSPKQSAMKKSL